MARPAIALDSQYCFPSNEALRLTLSRVTTPADIESVCELRFRGYRNVFATPESAWDEWDEQDNAVVLLATDQSNVPVGTVRLIDSLRASMEIDRYSPHFRRRFAPDSTFVEGTRLVAEESANVRKRVVQAALWKAAHRYAQARQLHFVIVWAKRGPDRGYRHLQLSKVDGAGFSHPLLGNKPHELYSLDVVRAEALFRSMEHPLWSFFFHDRHENLLWY